MYQQGDILIERVDKIFGENAKHKILARGETTGHAHRIGIGVAEIYEDASDMFLRVLSDTATIVHEEHLPVVVPAGDYRIRKVREYDHFEEEVKEIKD